MMLRHNAMFSRSVTQKAGVFSPVTGQAVVVQTTAADDEWAKECHSRETAPATPTGTTKKTRISVPERELVSRVESHTIAFKKKSKVRRNRRGGAVDLPIFSALNGMSKKEILNDIEAVGIVQTAINPNDKTKPEGFRSNATRIGGTVSMINTGNRDIPANVPVMWDAPFKNVPDNEYRETAIASECGEIKGHPEGIVYPAVRAYQEDDVAARLLEVFMHHLETDPTAGDPDEVLRWLDTGRKSENGRTGVYKNVDLSAADVGLGGTADFKNAAVQNCFGTGKGEGQDILKKKIAGILIERQRIIGWSLNHAHPGEQLDIILKKG